MSRDILRAYRKGHSINKISSLTGKNRLEVLHFLQDNDLPVTDRELGMADAPAREPAGERRRGDSMKPEEVNFWMQRWLPHPQLVGVNR